MPVYKDKIRNTWYCRVYLENEYGIKKQKSRSGFKTKAEAKAWELEMQTTPIANKVNITFQELYNVFIKSKMQVLKYQTIRAMVSKYKNHILPYFKDYPINKIDNKVYLDWKEQIINKNFSYKYNSSLHGCMVSILNYAMDFYDLDKNIAIKVGNFSKGDYIKKINFWTYDEFLNFIQVVDDNVLSALFQTLYYTGMRLGECLALTWNDLQDNYININKTLAKGLINGNYIITTPKTNKSIRKIKLNNFLLKTLHDLNDFYKSHVGYSDDWFIFGGLHALGQTTIRRKKNEYCKLANVKQIKIHDFRHSHASLLLSQGVPITAISERLGHSNSNMTLSVYTHLIPQDETKVIDTLDQLFIKQENFEKKINDINKKTL